jgi:WD40 repeat protein
MDGTVRLWSVATGKLRRSLNVGRKVVSLSFHPDGKTLALFQDIEDKLELWAVESGHKLFSLTTAPDRSEQSSFASVNTVVFSPDGSQIVVTDSDGNGIGLWNFRERSLKRIPNGENMVGLSFSGDGRWLVTLSSSQRISVFDATTFEKQDFAGIGSAGSGSETAVARVSLACSSSSAGELVAFTSSHNFIHIWSLDTGRRIDYFASGILRMGENSLAFRPDGRRLAIGNESDVVVIPLSTRQPTKALVSTPDKKINALSVRGDRRRIAWTANDDPHVVIWDPILKQPIHSLSGHLKGVLALSFGPPARPDLLASADTDGKVLVWDTSRAGSPLRILNGHTGVVQDVAILPDGQAVVSAGSDGTLRVWDVDTGKLKHVLDGKSGPLLGLAVSTDGRYVAAACGDQSVLVWNVHSGRRWLGPLAVGGMPNDVAFSPDGSQIAAGGSKPGPGGLVTVFNAHSGLKMSQWETPSLVRTLVFSSDGRRVVTGGTDGAIVVWDAVTGRETITLEGHKQAVLALVATPGLELYSAGIDGTVKLWEGLDPGPFKAKPLAADDRQILHLNK